tara:strand:+ start:33 stop:380 length:348 start_codon:yes stop_codon:yes gene_type:complete
MTAPMFKSVRPIVKATHPELYAEHTFHMKKCVAYTYNYSFLDDYIAEHWSSKTIQQIADDTNEYYQRVAYRSHVLQNIGIIQPKFRQDGSSFLKKERRELRFKLKQVEQKLEQCG